MYAFDSTTIDLCLSLFPWAPFQKGKAGIKMHTLLDLRGNIPTVIHVTDARVGDVRCFRTLYPKRARSTFSIADTWISRNSIGSISPRILRHPRLEKSCLPAALLTSGGSRHGATL